MKQQKEQYAIAKMARVLGVSRSGYYALEKSKHEEEDQKLQEVIKQIFEKHFGRYGSPRIWA